MMDLGVSSPQFDDPQRGFSYRYDARLDMRMDQTQTLDAYQIVNRYPAAELTRILREYGEERYASLIARAIVKNRAERPIETTFELVDIIKGALPEKELRKKGHPAKKTFQAIRIEVNDELGALKQGLEQALGMLNESGRCAVITFHSLEDRIVKNTFKDYSSAPFVEPKLPLVASQMEQASFRLITRKPVVASEGELTENNRSHSAKLRVIERIARGENHG
jgi:16S rRNA (cytosine1402-N4)-methyltransferase